MKELMWKESPNKNREMHGLILSIRNEMCDMICHICNNGGYDVLDAAEKLRRLGVIPYQNEEREHQS